MGNIPAALPTLLIRSILTILTTLVTHMIQDTHNTILETLDMIPDSIPGILDMIPDSTLGILDMIPDSIPEISDMIHGTLGINRMTPDTPRTIWQAR